MKTFILSLLFLPCLSYAGSFSAVKSDSGLSSDISAKVAKSSDTMTGPLAVKSTVTAYQFIGGGAGITGLAGVITSTAAIVASTGAIQANLDAVILSTGTLVLKAGDTMTGPLHLSSNTIAGSSVTLLGVVNVVNGRMGVGASPTSVLDINGISTFRDSLYIGANGAVGRLSWGSPSMILYAGSDRGLRFGVNANAVAVEISSSGYVGIGTNAPNTKLHISSSTITMDGTGAPPAGYALCIQTGGQMGRCSSVNAVDGTCTCVAP